MADILANSMTWFNSVTKSHAGASVTYSRGVDSVSLTVTLGAPSFGLDAGDPMIETWSGKDFLFPAADLILNSMLVEPARGDEIRLVSGADTLVFKVMSPGNIPEFKYSDRNRSRLRVHAKQVDTE